MRNYRLFPIALIGLFMTLVLAGSAAVAQGNPAAVDAPGAGAGVKSTRRNSISGRVVDPDGNGLAGFTVTASLVETKYPVILLPGVMGSRLRATQGEGCKQRASGIVWLNFEYLSDPILARESLETLYLDSHGDMPASAPCDTVAAEDLIDNIGPAWAIDVYRSISETLALNGYTVLTFPYDWRLDLDENAGELDKLINTVVGVTGKVYLVGHSMGGLLARSYVSNSDRAAKVAKVITVGTPYLGAPKAAYVMMTGKADLLPWLLRRWFEPSSQYVRQIVINSRGAMQLLPSRNYFSYGPYYFANGIDLNDYDKTAVYYVGQGQNGYVLNAADQFHQRLDDFRTNYHLSGDYYILAARHLPTASSILDSPACNIPFTPCDSRFRTTAYLLGDGTVPDVSSHMSVLGGSLRGPGNLCSYDRGSISKEHSELMASPSIQDDILKILSGETPVHCQLATQLAAESAEVAAGFREVAIWGDATVRVEDDAGHSVGPSSDGTWTHQLVDVTYDLVEGGVVVTLPEDAVYNILIESRSATPVWITGTDFAAANSDTAYTAQARAILAGVPVSATSTISVANASAPLGSFQAILTTPDGAQVIVPDAVLTDPVQAEDTTMPTTAISVAGTQNSEGKYSGPATVTLTAQDTGSGVLKSYTSLDNGQSWQEYGAPLTVQPGHATSVQAYSVDKAGNQEYPAQVRDLTFAGQTSLYLPAVIRAGANLVAARPAVAEDSTRSMLPSQPSRVVVSTSAILATAVYTATTGADGYYTLAGLPAGTYTVAAAKSGFTVQPASETMTLPPSRDSIDFTAGPAVVPTPIPIATPTPPSGPATAEEVLIPAGSFQMGCDSSNPAENGCNEYSGQERELPLHTVTLDAYHIDKYEVTNARYKACVDVGGCTAPGSTASNTHDPYYGTTTYADYPVLRVTWYQANTFCAWIGKRLPTEAEWEKAARGSSDTRRYPWGDSPPDCTKTNDYWPSGGCVGDATRVGSSPAGASPYGVMDMAGNVSEWVSDWYGDNYYSISPANNPQGPAVGTYPYRMVRGGVRSANRGWLAPGVWGDGNVGFRCARSGAAPATPTPIPIATPTPPSGPATTDEVLIPAGSFQMGCDSSNLAENGCNEYSGQTRELPLHTVTLDAYHIDKYEVTNARYKACVDVGGCTAPGSTASNTHDPYYGTATYADYPVLRVTWYQANTFCAWVGKRLPTEAEWEKAARGSSDTRRYPWGNSPPDCTKTNDYWPSGGCVGDATRVGASPAGASPYGVMDMAGNVSEWVNDWYGDNYYSISPANNPQGPAVGTYPYRMVRGGVRSANRGWLAPGVWGDGNVGFRCARSGAAPATPTPIPIATPTPPSGPATAEEVLIPAGSFQMGCDSSNLAENGCNEYSWQTRELPLHMVTLDAYHIDKYEVTNARYKACVDVGGCTAPGSTASNTHDPYYGTATYADYPVLRVTWYQANTFCAWVGKRLPTEAEWEKAARGSSDTRKYPWGNSPPDCTKTNYYWPSGGCVGDATRVGASPAGASPYGVMDMAGNVSEWVSDWYGNNYYSISPASNPQGPAAGTYNMVRGGSWFGDSSGVRSANRGYLSPGVWGDGNVGFRCARSP